MTKWTNFNDAEDQGNYSLMPHKTIAKVQLFLKKGNHVTEEFPDGYATLSKAGTSVYLACEFVILSGNHKDRKVWSNIGLHSDNSPKYADIGRSMIRAILESAYSIYPKDKSQEAERKREIKAFADLENLICVAEITINDKGDQPRNEIKTIITPDHAKYHEYMHSSHIIHKSEHKSNKLNKGYDSSGMLDSDEVPF